MKLLFLTIFCVSNLCSAETTTSLPPKVEETPTSVPPTTGEPLFPNHFDNEIARKDLLKSDIKLFEELKSDHELCFTGDQRSPVDLGLQNAELIYVPGLEFVNYDTTGAVSELETNHSDTLHGFNNWKNPPFIRGATLQGEYVLWEYQQNFYHSIEKRGDSIERNTISHRFNGASLSFEANFVHVKRGMTLEEARGVPGAIVNVAVQFKLNATIGYFTRTSILHSSKQQDLNKIRLFPNVTNGNIEEWIQPKELIPKDTTTFFSYNGSLAHAPCSPGVSWFVLTEPIHLNTFESWARFCPVGIQMNMIAELNYDAPTLGNRKLFFNYGPDRKPIPTENSHSTIGIIFFCVVVSGFISLAWYAVEKNEKNQPETEDGSVQFLVGNTEENEYKNITLRY